MKKINLLQFALLFLVLMIFLIPFVLASCSETDRGLDFYMKGTTSVGLFTKYTDYCRTNTIQVEYYCPSSDSSYASSEEGTCPSGYECLDGQCTQSSQIITCTDSDGSNYKNKGYIFTNTGSQVWDSCESSSVLKEAICDNNNMGTYKYTCSNLGSNWFCEDGACKQQQVTCTDSDKTVPFSNSYKIKGYVDVDGYKIWDECDGWTVKERICDGLNAGTSVINCVGTFGESWTCDDGACKESSVNIGCSDSDADILGNGKNARVKGYTTCGNVNHEDKCSDLKLGSVIESYCEGETCAIMNTPCSIFGDSWGCEDGRCVEGVITLNCTLQKCSDCGVGLFELCNKDECNACYESLGCIFTPKIIGGSCSIKGCDSCESYAISRLLPFWKSRNCSGGLLYNGVTCALTFVKILLVIPLVFVFVLLFGKNILSSLKFFKKKQDWINWIIALFFAVLLSVLMWFIYWIAILGLIILVIIKIFLKFIR